MFCERRMSDGRVFFRPLGEIMALFRPANFTGLMHFNGMVRDGCYMLPSQTFGMQVSALHPVARMKAAVFEEYARTLVVKREPAIVASPEMVGPHEDKRIETQTEVNPNSTLHH